MDASLLGGSKAPLHSAMFGPVCLLVQAIIIGVFYNAEFKFATDPTSVDSSSVFNYYVGVALMMFVGFGYLMTFLKGYGLGAVGLTMFITCIGVEYAMIIESYMGTGKLELDFYSLLNANFAVAAVLISFGGLIGKISPMQILVVVLVELTCYCANKVYFLGGSAKPGVIGDLVIADCGGTIIIHVFGAFFGLAAAKVLGDKDVPLNGSNYVSDLFSLVGTVFLWLYWPCFVSGALPPSEGQTAALTNTVLALLSSTVVTFALTPIMEKGKLTTVPIQNATLAGGVSIGATANAVGPFGAVVVGAIAGAVSTVGFIKGPTADFDTCGIFNLHGVPGLVGGIFSIVAPFMYDTDLMKKTGMDGVTQALALLITLVVSIVTGAGTGLALKAMGEPTQPFDDTEFWECNDYAKSE